MKQKGLHFVKRLKKYHLNMYKYSRFWRFFNFHPNYSKEFYL